MEDTFGVGVFDENPVLLYFRTARVARVDDLEGGYSISLVDTLQP